MSKRAIAIRHIGFEDLGTFAAPIAAAGYEIAYLEAGLDDLTPARTAELAVFLGGPIGVYETTAYPFMTDERAIAAERFASGAPMLGVCLGAQVIAAAAGAGVYPGAAGKEIGWAPLRLTKAGAKSVIAPLGEGEAQIFHWHGDTFDLPEGAVRLASTERYENQAFSLGDHILGFQFHPELDPATLEGWLIGHAVELAAAGIDPNRVREETARYGAALAERGRRAITAWLEGL